MITKKDFVDVQDFTKEEFLEMLETVRVLKEADQKGIQLPLLKGNTIALMFDQPSRVLAFPLSLPWTSWVATLCTWRPKPCMWVRGVRL